MTLAIRRQILVNDQEHASHLLFTGPLAPHYFSDSADMMRFYEVVPTLEQQKRWAPLLQGGEAASRVHLDAYERSLAEDWVQARQQIDRIEARGKAHAGMHGGMTRVTHGHEAHQHSGPGM